LFDVSSLKAEQRSIREEIDELSKQEGMLTKFDEKVWKSLVDHVRVIEKEDIRFIFRDGTEIRTRLSG
jgi:hypothetical protein